MEKELLERQIEICGRLIESINDIMDLIYNQQKEIEALKLKTDLLEQIIKENGLQ